MWQDSAARSAQIVEVLAGVTKRNIRDMEALLLKLTGYQTTISAKVYAECYFALQGMYGELYPNTDVFWSRPLSIASKRRLEERSRRSADITRYYGEAGRQANPVWSADITRYYGEAGRQANPVWSV